MHISGRFGTCPYVYVSYKIRLANAHFGQVWNLPLRPHFYKNQLANARFGQVWNLPLRCVDMLDGFGTCPYVHISIKTNWTMHVSGRFGTCPYGHVSYKIYLANAHFGQVWNLPLRCGDMLNGFGTCPYVITA